MFRRKTVVRRHHEGLEAGSEAEAAVVAVGPCSGADAETAAVDEDDDWEVGGGGGGGGGGFVEAEMEVVGFVEERVLPENRVVVVDGHVEV